MKHKSIRDFKVVLDVIRNNDLLHERIIIKGGVSLSIFLGLDNRKTKDIDTYLVGKDLKYEYDILDTLQDELKNQSIKSKRIELKKGKLPKLLLGELGIEITFKTSDTEVETIEHDGLIIVNPLDTLLDKIDRLSRLWKTQIKINPYDNIQNLLRGNYQRDLLDIYYLVKWYGKLSFDELENRFNYFKKIEDQKNKRSRNYNYDDFTEMISLFNGAVSYILNKTFNWEGYPSTFEKYLKSDKVFKSNYEDMNYQDFKNTILNYF